MVDTPDTPPRLPGSTVSAFVAMTAQRPGQLSAHFTLAEFVCPCGRWPRCTNARPHPDLVRLLERIRAKHYPNGLVIASGVRCPQHNRGLGGASSSQHLVGKAADLRHPRMTVAQAQRLGAIGIGWEERSGLVSHVDVRAKAATWMYAAGGARS